MTLHLNQLGEGRPYPLGAKFDGKGINFALFSAYAEKVELCLFDANGNTELKRLALPRCTHHVWHGYLEQAQPGTVYGYRVYGPYQPEKGHRFNHHKLLMDPYAKQFIGRFIPSESHYGYIRGSDLQDLSFSTEDNSRFIPKAQVIQDVEDFESIQTVPLSDTVIYETHLKGFSQQSLELKPEVRGKYLAFSESSVLEHLNNLAITSIEFLPLQYFLSEDFLLEKSLTNYWGYNPINFFTPHPDYQTENGLQELRASIRKLNQTGIEVLLDVVYNHTAEGDHLGPTLCYRGIDNHSYYRLQKSNPRFYVNDTGCGNTLKVEHPYVLKMVLDSLRYWVSKIGISGFRFDLATILARTESGYRADSAFFHATLQDPLLNQTKLIAEPWDIGPGGYQLGQFPASWSEWNDKYRDTIRAFWRGDQGVLSDFARRIHGSADLFDSPGRNPFATVNFLTSHDGFTLHDLVTYKQRHNLLNGESNRDGHHNNLSENYGIEGETDDQEIVNLRLRQKKNLLLTLFCSQGVPMLQAGDELSRTQQGNNNAYCQDNPINWIDWASNKKEHDLSDFVAQLILIRTHSQLFSLPYYVHNLDKPNRAQISWLNAQGQLMSELDWQSDKNVLGLLVRQPESHQQQNAEAFLVLFNASVDFIDFHLPATVFQCNWRILLSTSKQFKYSDSIHSKDDRVCMEPRSSTILQGLFKEVVDNE